MVQIDKIKGILSHKHKANEVKIKDVGGYYVGTEVETALQEIGANFVSENIWDRAGTTVTLHNSGDLLSLSGNVYITKTAPELRLTDGDYSRLTRVTASNKLNLYNRVSTPASGSPFLFSGDNALRYFTLPNNALLRPTTAISIECWIYPTSVLSTVSSVVTQDYVSLTNKGYVLTLVGNGGAPTILWRLGNGTTITSIQTPVANNTWYYVVGTWDGTTMHLYVNNVEIGTGTAFAGPISYTAQSTKIGSWNYSGTDFSFAGSIDEVVIWSKMLSAAEVNTNYAAGSGLYGGAATNLVGGYHLDEGAGTSAADFSGNLLTATGTSNLWAASIKAVPAPTTVEVSVVNSQDGVAGAEQGIHTFGTASGQSILQGSNVWLKDSNGNELLTTAQVASALNQLTITNAATTTNPILSATGGDANIGINLNPKGTGAVTINGASISSVNLVVNALLNTGSDLTQWNINSVLKAQIGSLGQFRSSAGTAALPGHSFTGNTNYGMYTTGGQFLGMSSAGLLAFKIKGIASAVNNVFTQSAITGVAPDIGVEGADANVSLTISAKNTSSSLALRLGTTNFLSISGSGTRFDGHFIGNMSAGTAASLGAQIGSATDFGLYLVGMTAQTADLINVKSVGGTNNIFQVGSASVASPVNGISVALSATGAKVGLSAIGSDINITNSIAGKGTGVVQVTSPLTDKNTQTALTDTATLTIAQLLTKVIDGTPTAPANYTLPTAALLVGGILNCVVGDSFSFLINNKSAGANTITVLAGGATLYGTATVAQNIVRQFRVVVTNVTGGAEAYTTYCIE